MPHAALVEATETYFDPHAVGDPIPTEKGVKGFVEEAAASTSHTYPNLLSSGPMYETWTLPKARAKSLDETYPDWLAWIALAALLLFVGAVGCAIYAGLVAHSAVWGLGSSLVLLVSAVAWYFVLAKAEMFIRS